MQWRFWRRKPKLYPGSEAAAKSGCLCPVGLNHAGKKKPKGGWRTRSACPLHGQIEEATHVREAQKEGW